MRELTDFEITMVAGGVDEEPEIIISGASVRQVDVAVEAAANLPAGSYTMGTTPGVGR